MASVAVLICTTLISTVGNMTTATRDCREVASPIATTAITQNETVITMQPPAVNTNDIIIERGAEKNKTKKLPAEAVDERALLPASDALSLTKAKPAIAKPNKSKRLKADRKIPKRKLRKAPRRIAAVRDKNRFLRPTLQQQPPKKITMWERLKGILN